MHADECPTSFIRAESIGWLEVYAATRQFAAGTVLDLPARMVDAMCVIATEAAKEMKRNGQQA